MAHSVETEAYTWIVLYEDGTRLVEADVCTEHEAGRVDPGACHVWACVDKARVDSLYLQGAGVIVDCSAPGREPVFFRRRVISDVLNEGIVDPECGSTWVGYQVGGEDFLTGIRDSDGHMIIGAAR